jgi:hypothetical protein
MKSKQQINQDSDQVMITMMWPAVSSVELVEIVHAAQYTCDLHTQGTRQRVFHHFFVYLFFNPRLMPSSLCSLALTSLSSSLLLIMTEGVSAAVTQHRNCFTLSVFSAVCVGAAGRGAASPTQYNTSFHSSCSGSQAMRGGGCQL